MIQIENYRKTEEECLMQIPIGSIRTNPYQPRKSFSDEALHELSASIRRYGLLQPITVRRIRNGYELIAGERRLRASKLAGLHMISCIVIPQLADQDSAMLAMIENLQRENLNFFEEAEGYQNLIKKNGLTQEELARRLSKNQSTIANKLRILRLPKSVRERILHHALTERHARALLRLHDEKAQLSMIDKIVRDGLSVKATEILVEKELLRLYGEEEETPEKDSKTEEETFIETIKSLIARRSELRCSVEESEENDYREIRIRFYSH
ncbi:MAG: ParB/RepB/Spo0J family partition protein [Christensenellaceae bacterium]|nr:ParB/RepB/Spo0J family partition protein [Christensenellaceae bacterium]